MIKYIASALFFIMPIVGTNECIANSNSDLSVRCETPLDHKDADVFAMIHRFYEEYLAAENHGKEKIIEQKYVDRQLLRLIERMTANEELDYNPFWQGQDYGTDFLSKLRVEKAPTGRNTYRVYIWSSYHKEYRYVDMVVKKIGNEYKIADIPSLRSNK